METNTQMAFIFLAGLQLLTCMAYAQSIYNCRKREENDNEYIDFLIKHIDSKNEYILQETLWFRDLIASRNKFIKFDTSNDPVLKILDEIIEEKTNEVDITDVFKQSINSK